MLSKVSQCHMLVLGATLAFLTFALFFLSSCGASKDQAVEDQTVYSENEDANRFARKYNATNPPRSITPDDITLEEKYCTVKYFDLDHVQIEISCFEGGPTLTCIGKAGYSPDEFAAFLDETSHALRAYWECSEEEAEEILSQLSEGEHPLNNYEEIRYKLVHLTTDGTMEFEVRDYVNGLDDRLVD